MTPLRPLRPRPLAEGPSINVRQHPDSSANRTAESGTGAGLGPGRPSINLRRPARQRKANSACDPCRRRKTKCDGRLPRCVMCDQRPETCEYTYTVRHRVTLAEVEHSERGGPAEMLESLRTLPPKQALELFHKLRNELPSRGLGLSRPSDQQHLRGLLPPTQNSINFELTIRHPVAYPALFPVPYTDLTLGALLKPTTKPWLEGRQATLSREVSPFSGPYLTPERDAEENVVPKSGSPDSTGVAVRSPLFDERLRLLDITKWTSIPIPNDLAISIISHYLEIDYAAIPLFNADLFVRDLINLQHFFCSPFLVTAVLSWACQAFTTLHPDAAAFSVALFAESQQYFSDQQQPNSVTSIAALQILSMCAVTYGKDDMSLRFLQESVRLGKAMGLFNVQSEAESATVWLGGHAEWTRAASYTAWGVYNWVSVYSLHYRVQEIHTPPLLPMPRDLIVLLPSDDAWSAKTAFHAQSLSAASDLWIIFKDILERLHDPQYRGVQLESLRFAEGTYHRLLSWASGLSLEMARGEASDHSVMLLHVYFHAVVTDLFRPCLAADFKSQRLYSFSTKHATPEAVYASSVTQLKRLLLLYRLRYKNANYSVLWQTAVVYVANAMIQEGGVSLPRADGQTSNEWRFYLDLCLAGLEDLYASFPVFGSVAQGMVGMALRHSAIPTEKAARVLAQLDEIDRRHAAIKGMTDKTEAQWIIDLDLATTDFERARARNLVEELRKLMAEQSESENVG
ncbi:hypothetical protein CORC01_12998 [Colletotrichum orchidophilum]|uniref:Zn(2)-C6 fungal-type domain-containing protein n=1 Tax=Colletotrichum orchidophilum TaxID=1209926 RepID=A0A1G4ARA8_9PEZI|nr:uncharacterized protein CORC01_12998 [Colletotrichum orchidophilum]OHE91707.1 hypothetical protein CORC01_12998 [Colletotrichum orchidophilum]